MANYFGGRQVLLPFRAANRGRPRASNLGGRSTSVDHNAIRPPDRRHKYPSAYMSKHHGRDVRAADLKIRSATAAARRNKFLRVASSRILVASALFAPSWSTTKSESGAKWRKKKKKKKKKETYQAWVALLGSEERRTTKPTPSPPSCIRAHIARCYICYDVIQEFDRSPVMTFRRN